MTKIVFADGKVKEAFDKLKNSPDEKSVGRGEEVAVGGGEKIYIS